MRGPCRLALLALALAVAAAAAGGHDFRRDFDVVWGEGNARFLDGGRQVELSLDERTGARLQSKERYLFGRFDLEIKLVAGESAGTITSFYVSALHILARLLLFTDRSAAWSNRVVALRKDYWSMSFEITPSRE